MVICIVFFSLYWISLPFIGNSLFLLFFSGLLFRSKFTYKQIFRIFKDPVIGSLVFSIVSLIVLSGFIGYLSEANDYSYSWVVFRQVPYFICAVYIGLFLAKEMVFASGKRSLDEYVLTVGWMQGIVVLIAFSIPEFRLWLLPFQGSENLDFLMMPGNLGVRGYALAAQQFFGLSAMLSIQAVIIFTWLVSKKEAINLLILIKFILFGVACIFVGRTSGVVFFLCLSGLIVVLPGRKKITFTAILGLFIFVAYLLIDFDQPSYRWAFEIIFNFIDGDGFGMASLDNLTQDMLFTPTLSQLLIGDGFYTNLDGGYYLGTDSGLLRPILFGGLSIFILTLFPYIAMFVCVVRSKRIAHERKLPLMAAVFAAVVLQIKGEVLIIGTMSNILIFIYYTYSVFEVNFHRNHVV